jgi:hypothetical protein
MEFEGGENYDIYRNYKNGVYNADEIMFKDGIITEAEQDDFLHLPKIFNAPEYTMIDTVTTLLEFTDFYKDNSEYNIRIKIEDLLKYYKISIDRENKMIILDYFEICELCGQNIVKHKGCDCKTIELNGVVYTRVKAGGDGDYHDGSRSFKTCECCGAEKEKHHHYGCPNEYCPACGITLIQCDCSREQSRTELKNGINLDSRESQEERERIHKSRKGINYEEEDYIGPYPF